MTASGTDTVSPILQYMSEFGGLIRDAREKLGLSPHRVAELIGRGQGSVKAWERGRAVPTDPFVITSLAAVLALDETRLFHAAGLEVPDRQPHLTIEQELATIAPPKSGAPSGESRPVSTETRPVTPAVAPPKQFPDADQTAAPTAAVSAPVPSASSSARREPAPRRVADRRVPVDAPVSGSYMDDPEERWSYRLRTVWTAAGMVGLGILLLWAGSRALDALGETWDLLLAGL